MRISRSVLLLVVVVCLMEVDGNSMRERFLSLRNRSSSLRKLTTTTTTTTETPQESESSSPLPAIASSTETPTTTTAVRASVSTLKEKLAKRRPQLRLGNRQATKKSKKIDKKKTSEVKKEALVGNEPKREKSLSPSSRRGRFNLSSLRNRRGKTETVDEVTTESPPLEVAPPKVVEIAAKPISHFRRPPLPSRRHRKTTEDRKSKAIPLRDNFRLPLPIGSMEMPKEKMMETAAKNENIRDSERFVKPKTSNRHQKIDQPIEHKPFSFKFYPLPNPMRNSVPESQPMAAAPVKNVEELEAPIVLIPTKPVNTVTEIPPINFFENYFEAERFPSSNPENDTLITSETRTRSKIEIKEVNGTLYEYEYIYYYDDEPLPLTEYDYDLGPNELIEVTTPTTKLPPVVTTTEAPPRTRSPINRVRNQNSRFNEIVPERVLEPRPRTRPSSRGTSRSRDNSRALVQETAPRENTIHDLQVEELPLPIRTRFPPRPTPPSRTVESFVTTDRLEAFTFDFVTNSDVVTPSANEFNDDLTTFNPPTPSDTGAINLYALSKALDADFDSTTTVAPAGDETTESVIDYESLYDYDFSLTDFDLATTTDSDLVHVTEEETTTIVPTTMAPLTTTIIATTVPSLSRLRGASRFRGSALPKAVKEEVTETEKPVTEPSIVRSKNGRGNLNRPRIRRPGLRTRPTTSKTVEKEIEPIAVEKIENALEIEAIVSTTTTVASTTVKKPSRGRLSRQRSRPRPTLGNRFRPRGKKPQPTEPKAEVEIAEVDKKEEPLEESVVVEPIVSTTSRPKPSRRRPNQRRPRPRNNLLSRFNRKKPTPTVEKTEEPTDMEKQNLNETDTKSESEAMEKPKEEVIEVTTTTESPKPVRVGSGSHRFNLPNRRPSRRRRPNPRKPKEEPKPVEEEEVVATPEDEATKAVAAADESNVSTTTTVSPVVTAQKSRGSRFGGRHSRTRGRNSVPSHRRRIHGTTIAPEPQPEPQVEIVSETSPVVESAVEKEEIIPETPAPKRQRTRGRNMFIPGKRTKSNRRLSALIKKENKDDVTTVSETKPVGIDEAIVIEENPTSEVKESPMEEEPIVAPEPEPESEPEPEPEDTTGTTSEAPPVETTTEKLTRRQILARRRSKFLG